MTIRAVTLDFGNTLVPVPAGGLRAVVDETAGAMAARLGPFDVEEVRRLWGEERERQFREEVPRFREVDMAQRVVRILARLRGMDAPPPDVPWDDGAAARRSSPDEVAWAVGVYSGAFVAALPPAPAAGALIARLATRYRVAILSNWPLAATIDRYVAAAGWAPHLTAVVVSQRVGTIKPHPAIFAAALAALDGPARGAAGSVVDGRDSALAGRGPAPAPDEVLHVGDDWAADVVGAKRAGWRAAWLAVRPDDSPLPGSARDDSVAVDLVIHDLAELETGIGRLGG